MKIKYFTSTVAMGVLLLSACTKENKDAAKPVDPGAGDQEVVTKVTVHLTNIADTTQHVMASWNDPDGEVGSQLPTVQELVLKPGANYRGELELTDATKNPAFDITEEIEEEADEHRFHFTFTASTGSGANMAITILDQDADGQPLGLNFRIETSTVTGTGNFNINLRHFGEGTTKSNDPTAGETDLLIDFPVKIQ